MLIDLVGQTQKSASPHLGRVRGDAQSYVTEIGDWAPVCTRSLKSGRRGFKIIQANKNHKGHPKLDQRIKLLASSIAMNISLPSRLKALGLPVAILTRS